MPYRQNGRQSYFRVPEFPFGTPRRQGDSFPSEGMLPEPDSHKLISENDDKGAIFMKKILISSKIFEIYRVLFSIIYLIFFFK